MKIDKNTWHAKLFFWSMRAWRKFKFGQNWDKEVLVKDLLKGGTNLCEYIRVMFLWMPLVLLLHIVFYGTILAAFLVVPIALFGVGSYLKATGSIVGTVIVGIIALFTFVFIIDQLSRRLSPRIRKIKRGEFSGFPRVLSEWAKAKKEKVCPFVEFVDGEKEGAP